MWQAIATSVILMIAVPVILASGNESPDVGQQTREIKALDRETIEGYLSGSGMGMAKVAELNHYPGPIHVLDLTEKLQLSQVQLTKTREIYNKMHQAAIPLGKEIVEQEKILDSLFATQTIDETQLQDRVDEIARLQGKLRGVHLKAHLEMKRILSSEQIDKYDELRGYSASKTPDSHHHH